MDGLHSAAMQEANLHRQIEELSIAYNHASQEWHGLTETSGRIAVFQTFAIKCFYCTVFDTQRPNGEDLLCRKKSEQPGCCIGSPRKDTRQ